MREYGIEREWQRDRGMEEIPERPSVLRNGVIMIE